MNILVTGAKGFLGRNLVENLKTLRDGKNRTRPGITCMCSNRPRRRVTSRYKKTIAPGNTTPIGPFVITANPQNRYISQYFSCIKQSSAPVIKNSSVVSVTEALPIYMIMTVVPMTRPDQKPALALNCRAAERVVINTAPMAISEAGMRAANSENPPNSFREATNSQ